MVEQEVEEQEDYEVKIGSFNGPMDLLVYLVQKKEMSLDQIPIAEIADDFLKWVNEYTETDLSKAGDFLFMASRLMALKVQELLPAEERDPEMEAEFNEDREQLMKEMLEYQRFKQVASGLQEMEGKNFGTYSRGRLEKTQSDDDTLADANIWQLFRAYQKSLKTKISETIHHIELDYVTIQDRQQAISNYLSVSGRALFEDLLDNDSHPIVAAVTFMAMLEMIKTDDIVFRQSELFGPIWIYRKKNNAEYAEEMAHETVFFSKDPDVKPGLVETLRSQALARSKEQSVGDLAAVMREAVLWTSRGRNVSEDDLTAMLEGREDISEVQENPFDEAGQAADAANVDVASAIEQQATAQGDATAAGDATTEAGDASAAAENATAAGDATAATTAIATGDATAAGDAAAAAATTVFADSFATDSADNSAAALTAATATSATSAISAQDFASASRIEPAPDESDFSDSGDLSTSNISNGDLGTSDINSSSYESDFGDSSVSHNVFEPETEADSENSTANFEANENSSNFETTPEVAQDATQEAPVISEDAVKQMSDEEFAAFMQKAQEFYNNASGSTSASQAAAHESVKTHSGKPRIDFDSEPSISKSTFETKRPEESFATDSYSHIEPAQDEPEEDDRFSSVSYGNEMTDAEYIAFLNRSARASRKAEQKAEKKTEKQSFPKPEKKFVTPEQDDENGMTEEEYKAYLAEHGDSDEEDEGPVVYGANN